MAVALTAAGLIATVGTHNALTLAFARLPVALARDGYFPKALTRRNAHGAPWVSM